MSTNESAAAASMTPSEARQVTRIAQLIRDGITHSPGERAEIEAVLDRYRGCDWADALEAVYLAGKG